MKKNSTFLNLDIIMTFEDSEYFTNNGFIVIQASDGIIYTRLL